jgi:probable phosphoglycerate mutase
MVACTLLRLGEPALLCVVRHGETDWNAEGVLQGSIDVPLNDTGRRQAGELGALLAAAGIVAVHSSSLARSRETAAIVAGRLGLAAPTLHDGLKERYFGAIEGSAKAVLAAANPVLHRQIHRRDPAGSFAGGELMEAFAARVLEAIHGIAALHAGTRALVVTHGWAIDVIARAADGLAPTAILDSKPANCECLWLAVDDRSLRRQAPRPADCD